MKKKQIDDDAILMVDLDRFGAAIASTLNGLGHEVPAIERDPILVQQWSHGFGIIEGGATSVDALEQAGTREFGVAVVGIGSSLEASILAAANLTDLGMKQIWARATSRSHGRTLRHISAHHVVYPEYDAGVRVTYMVDGKMPNYVEMEDGFSIIKMRPPRDIQEFMVAESKVRERFGVTIIGVRAPGQPFEYVAEETKIGPKNVIIVSGDSALLEESANR